MDVDAYDTLVAENGNVVKMWTKGVPVEAGATKQLLNIAQMPFIFKHVAAMPDVHIGIGATVGSVIATKAAVIPAAVGVDIGCGMMAAKTSLNARDLPDNLDPLRADIERTIPHGRSNHRGGKRDFGAWGEPPVKVLEAWQTLEKRFAQLVAKYPRFANTNNLNHLGTLGTGNHFIEICLDENDAVWVMLHSGSRGIGNAIGTFFIELAKKDMKKWFINIPDQDLAYFPEGTQHFDDYVEAVEWAQDFAAMNRQIMMELVIHSMRHHLKIPFAADIEAINCHHNYVRKEHHFGENVLVTRKGAVRAARGTMGIIPGSMGAKSFIVRGLGCADSFESCSHGAGRIMSRTAAKKLVSIDDHVRATQGVSCRKDVSVIDETPAAYKPIDAVMEAQKDLVEIVHTLKQVICVKG